MTNTDYTATCWYGEQFPLTQAQNAHASWPFAVAFAVCSSVTLWSGQLAFVATASYLMPV